MNLLSANALWLLRIGLASVFVYHGVLKFLNLQGFTEMLPISYIEVVLVALAETAGGLLVLVGGFGGDARFDFAARLAESNFRPCLSS